MNMIIIAYYQNRACRATSPLGGALNEYEIRALPSIEIPAPHGVEHFWLCERCSQEFALVYKPGQGVVLVLRWEALSVAIPPKELTAA